MKTVLDSWLLRCYNGSMMNNILKWTALVCTIAGALCTSFRIDPMNIFLCNAGSLLYLLWAIRIRELNLVIVNAGLLAIYMTGFWYTFR